MKVKDLSGRVAVITGGSSGIGLSIAESICEAGGEVVLVARNQEKLDAAAKTLKGKGGKGGKGGKVHTVSADVTKISEIRELQKKTLELAPAIDLLINSAGVVSAGLLQEVPIKEWDRLHQINVRGLVQVLSTFIPDMIEQHKIDGLARYIVNISSAAGFSAVPGMSAYGATKAAVTALSESLRGELAPHEIGVTALCPGFVQTPIAETVQLFGSMDTPKMQKNIERMFAIGNLKPEKVAQRTMRAIAKNRGMVVVGREAKGSHLLKRVAPGLFQEFVAFAAKPR